MATTYTWHPGSRCLNPRWPIPVSLLPDELFSSWLTRTALMHGCDPLALTGEIWTGWRAWTRDIDRGISSDKLILLTAESGIELNKLKAATLRSIATHITNKNLRGLAIWPWILVLGSRNRKHHGGLQYCSTCLAKDKKPYYRLQWRLAWNIGCLQCGCQLHDRCPKCNSAIEPHRLLAMDNNLELCMNCHTDLRNAVYKTPFMDAMLFQATADKVITDRFGYYGHERLSSSEWFYLARYFIRLIRRACVTKAKNLPDFIRLVGINIDSFQSPATGLAFEFLPIGERASLLESAWKLITLKSTEFLYGAKETSLTLQSINEPHQKLPECINKLVSELPSKSIIRRKIKKQYFGPRSHQVVKRMWARLLRKREF